MKSGYLERLLHGNYLLWIYTPLCMVKSLCPLINPRAFAWCQAVWGIRGPEFRRHCSPCLWEICRRTVHRTGVVSLCRVMACVAHRIDLAMLLPAIGLISRFPVGTSAFPAHPYSRCPRPQEPILSALSTNPGAISLSSSLWRPQKTLMPTEHQTAGKVKGLISWQGWDSTCVCDLFVSHHLVKSSCAVSVPFWSLGVHAMAWSEWTWTHSSLALSTP